MRFNFGVPTFNRYDLLSELIESIDRSSIRPEIVYIIDNGSNGHCCGGGGFELDREISVPVVVVPVGSNLGVAASWNVLHKLSSPVPIVISNDDIVLGRNTLQSMFSWWTNDTPLILTCRGWSLFCQNEEAWKAVGEYDEGFFPAYFEDNDYARRAALKNVNRIEVHDQEVAHAGSATIARLNGAESGSHKVRFLRNRDRYISKWGGLPGSEKYESPFGDSFR